MQKVVCVFLFVVKNFKKCKGVCCEVKLMEFEGKKLFSEMGIPVPKNMTAEKF
jgi:hypothetical protein